MFILCAVLLGEAFAQESSSDPYRTVVWKERPIAISMLVGQEKILSFDEDVQWSIPRELIGLVEGESIAGQVLITANSDFEKARFRFRGLTSNTFFIIDITASNRGDSTPIKVRLIEETLHNSVSAPQARPEKRRRSGIPQLTRFAFQAVYAPERLVRAPWDVTSVRIHNTAPRFRLLPGYEVQLTPIAQWKNSDGRYAIALELKNLENQAVSLDPRRIRSEASWRSFGTLTDRLEPSGQRGDTTTAVVIANGIWGEVSEWLR